MERSDFSEIVQKFRDFNRERDWEQFHDAKNLALSISIEASELNECFLWKNAEEANRAKVEEELSLFVRHRHYVQRVIKTYC